jgi:hypothetical protein
MDEPSLYLHSFLDSLAGFKLPGGFWPTPVTFDPPLSNFSRPQRKMTRPCAILFVHNGIWPAPA